VKILVLNYEYPPLGGGGGIATKLVAEELVKRGHDVHVLTSIFGIQKKFEIIEGVNIHRVKVWGRKSLSFASTISLFSWLLTSITLRYIALPQK
jgi:L-malate glycosyltransferase